MCFAGNRAALELQSAAVRIAAQLSTSLDDRRMQRSCTEERMWRSRLQIAIESLETRQHTAHSDDRVTSIGRAAAVSGAAFHLNRRPREALVTDAALQGGR